MMIKVRVASESFGSGKPNIVYSSCHERMTAAIARAIQRGVLNPVSHQVQSGGDGKLEIDRNIKNGLHFSYSMFIKHTLLQRWARATTFATTDVVLLPTYLSDIVMHCS